MARDWALALHGGAGVIVRNMDPSEERAYLEALEASLGIGAAALGRGASAMDAVEEVVVSLEENPLFNAGKGSAFNHDGHHELEASIMDGASLRCGAVILCRTVRNPVRLARRIMDTTEHVALAGTGAERFADRFEDLERVDNGWFSTPRRRGQWELAVERGEGTLPDMHGSGTVGCVARDTSGNLAAATSTGGRTNKLPGRVGDSPWIGAGNYASNRSCAVSGTGTGEQFIRHTVAREVGALVEYRGATLAEACAEVVHERLDKGDGGVIAVDAAGTVCMPFNSEGMFRAAADSAGMKIVKIWS